MPPEWRNWHTQQTQNVDFAVFVRFETLLSNLRLQKKVRSMRFRRLPDFWRLFDAF
jgi:hypothetical protein